MVIEVKAGDLLAAELKAEDLVEIKIKAGDLLAAELNAKDLVKIKIKPGDLFEIKEGDDKDSKIKKVVKRWESTESRK
jgi:hypothetical protein